MVRAMLLVEMLGVLEVLGGPGRNGVSARNKAILNQSTKAMKIRFHLNISIFN